MGSIPKGRDPVEWPDTPSPCSLCRDRLGSSSGPGEETTIYTYRLHLEAGSDAGEVTYAVLVKPGEEILVRNRRRFRVLVVVPFDEEDDSPFVGLLQVEAA